jgi:hypothetical protein
MIDLMENVNVDIRSIHNKEIGLGVGSVLASLDTVELEQLPIPELNKSEFVALYSSE